MDRQRRRRRVGHRRALLWSCSTIPLLCQAARPISAASRCGRQLGGAAAASGSRSEAVSPALVRQRGPARLTVPDEPSGARLAALLDAQVDRAPDFHTEAWRKLCLNAVAAVMVLTGRRAEVYRDPEQLALARALAEECVAVGRAEGADLASGTTDEIVAQLAAMPPDLGTSMLFDRLAGRRLEWDARNGVVARLGARHGIPTPVSADVSAQLEALDGAG